MKIKLIIAIDKNGVMGNKNKLPWKLSDDLKHFKEITNTHPLLMGSETYKSLPGILPNREHIVLSNTLNSSQDISVFTSIAEVLNYMLEIDAEILYVIGGVNVAEQFLKLNILDELIITHVDADVKGDVSIDLNLLKLEYWDKISDVAYSKNEKNEYDFKICKYIKKHKRFYQ